MQVHLVEIGSVVQLATARQHFARSYQISMVAMYRQVDQERGFWLVGVTRAGHERSEQGRDECVMSVLFWRGFLVLRGQLVLEIRGVLAEVVGQTADRGQLRKVLALGKRRVIPQAPPGALRNRLQVQRERFRLPEYALAFISRTRQEGHLRNTPNSRMSRPSDS